MKRMIDLDSFLLDLQNESCDVCKTDQRCPLYSEYGYSYDLIERVAERQTATYIREATYAGDK